MSDAPQKSEPEELVLRGKPRRVTRFRRNVVIGVAAAVTAVVCGAAWLALRTPSLKMKTNADELYDTDSKPSPDQLASLPPSYDKVKPPRLGPPLPGDLGAPIVAREKQLGMNPVSGSFDENNAEHAEHLRQAQLAQQAREAKVMFQTSDGNRTPEVTARASQTNPTTPLNTQPASPVLADDQNGQQHKIGFTRQRDDSGIYNAHGLVKPASDFELFAGTVIPASLITGINSDLPGLAIAQVTQNLYGISGVLLLPAGSRMLGKIDSVVAFGQSRALVVWQRIVMPNGTSIEIDNTPASDTEGYSGLEDEVDYHTWRLIKGVALSTLLGVGAQLSVNNSNDDLLTALRESAQDSANQAGQQITQRNVSIQPTITIRPGWPLRAILAKDLVLQPYQG